MRPTRSKRGSRVRDWLDERHAQLAPAIERCWRTGRVVALGLGGTGGYALVLPDALVTARELDGTDPFAEAASVLAGWQEAGRVRVDDAATGRCAYVLRMSPED